MLNSNGIVTWALEQYEIMQTNVNWWIGDVIRWCYGSNNLEIIPGVCTNLRNSKWLRNEWEI